MLIDRLNGDGRLPSSEAEGEKTAMTTWILDPEKLQEAEFTPFNPCKDKTIDGKEKFEKDFRTLNQELHAIFRSFGYLEAGDEEAETPDYATIPEHNFQRTFCFSILNWKMAAEAPRWLPKVQKLLLEQEVAWQLNVITEFEDDAGKGVEDEEGTATLCIRSNEIVAEMPGPKLAQAFGCPQ